MNFEARFVINISTTVPRAYLVLSNFPRSAPKDWIVLKDRNVGDPMKRELNTGKRGILKDDVIIMDIYLS